MREGSRRIYSNRDHVRLKLILRGKRLGFSLAEVADIIEMYDAEPGESGQLEYFLKSIESRKKQLQQQANDIKVTLKELATIEKQCRQQLKRITEVG